MAELCILFASLAVAHAFLSLRQGNWVALPLAVLAMETLASAIFWYSDYQSAYSKIWSRGGNIINGEQNVIYFFFIYLTLLIVYIFEVRRHGYSDGRSAISATINKKGGGKIPYMPIALLLFAGYHFYILDKDIIYKSTEYLLMASPEAVIVKSPINLFVQSIHKFVGVIAIFNLGSAIVKRKRLDTIILIPPCLWFYLFQLGAHSRFSVVNAVCFAIPFLISNRGSHRFTGLLCFAFASLNLMSSLNGRGTTTQGFAAIENYFYDALKMSPDGILEVIANILEGVFVQGDGFFYTGHQYNLEYKLKALSPLPSLIDGYAKSFQMDQIRIHPYVPMGATSEVRIFGPGYTAFYFMICSYSYSRLFYFARRKKIFALLACTMIFTLAIYLQFTYPIRNVFRFFYITIIIYMADLIASSFLFHKQEK